MYLKISVRRLLKEFYKKKGYKSKKLTLNDFLQKLEE